MRLKKTCLWLAIVAAPLCSGCWRNNRCQPVCNPCYGAQSYAPAYSGGYATQGCGPVYASGYATNSCAPVYSTAQTPLAPIPQVNGGSPSGATVATNGKKSL